MNELDLERVVRSPYAAGAIGAMVTAVKFTPGATWRERVVNVVAGCLAAGYLTPAVTEWLHMATPGYVSGAAFVFGLVGMSLAGALITAIKELPIATILAGWLTRRG